MEQLEELKRRLAAEIERARQNVRDIRAVEERVHLELAKARGLLGDRRPLLTRRGRGKRKQVMFSGDEDSLNFGRLGLATLCHQGPTRRFAEKIEKVRP